MISLPEAKASVTVCCTSALDSSILFRIDEEELDELELDDEELLELLILRMYMISVCRACGSYFVAVTHVTKCPPKYACIDA